MLAREYRLVDELVVRLSELINYAKLFDDVEIMPLNKYDKILKKKHG